MIEIGKKIGERYKIISHIGTGGMANVYLARDLILDRDVAVKVLRFDFRNNKEALRRFQRESLSATQLVHPHIVEVYDVDEDDGLQYIVMEFVEGTDLKKYIQQHGKASPEDAVHIMSQVLSAIALAHRNRIIHRDIKPQNLLIDEDNVIKITDFGIAVALSETSITQTNSLLGSVHYISPEQARGSITTFKSDIYALGIVLYELLTGEVPYDGESAVSIALKHFQEPIPSVKEKNLDVPQSLENVILKATAKELPDRYDSCEEMLTDLESALNPSRMNETKYVPMAMLDETKVLEHIKPQTEKTQAAPVATREEPKTEIVKEKTARKNKKSKKSWWLLALFLVLVAIGFGIFAVMNREPDPVAVPVISNVNAATAQNMLEDAGLEVGSVIDEYSAEIAEDFVIRTEPESGEPVPVGSKVDLFISVGQEPIAFGDYMGEDYDEARDALRDLGFVVERFDSYDEAEIGTVIAQSVDPDTAIIPGSETITLTVSMGIESFTMDSLAGYTRVSVEDYARPYDLNVTFEEQNSDDIAEGLVISQSIEPQSNFNRGDSMTVILSKGPADPEVIVFARTITVEYVAPKTPINESGSDNASSTGEENSNSDAESDESKSQEPLSNHIVIRMQDADHNIDDVFREFDITENQDVTLNFRIMEGEFGAYIVERDGEIVMQEEKIVE